MVLSLLTTDEMPKCKSSGPNDVSSLPLFTNPIGQSVALYRVTHSPGIIELMHEDLRY